MSFDIPAASVTELAPPRPEARKVLPYWVSPIRKGMAAAPDGTPFAAWIIDVAPSRAQRHTQTVRCAVPLAIGQDEAASMLAAQAVEAARPFYQMPEDAG